MSIMLLKLLFLPLVISFTPSHILSGPAGKNLNVFAVPNKIGFQYIQRCQIEAIKKNRPKDICSELNNSRELIRGEGKEKLHVSFLTAKNADKNLFTIIYRMSDTLPKVYTIEALFRGEEEPLISSLDILTILDQMVTDRKGHLQIYPLKKWSGGRYMNEMHIEKQFSFKL